MSRKMLRDHGGHGKEEECDHTSPETGHLERLGKHYALLRGFLRRLFALVDIPCTQGLEANALWLGAKQKDAWREP